MAAFGKNAVFCTNLMADYLHFFGQKHFSTHRSVTH